MSVLFKNPSATFQGYIYRNEHKSFHLHFPDPIIRTYQLYSTDAPVFFNSVYNAEMYIQLLGHEIK